MKILSHMWTGKSLVIVFVDPKKGTQTKIADSSHLNWKQLEQAYKAGNFNKIVELIDVSGAINAKFKGKFEVRNGVVYYGNEKAHGYLVDRIISYMQNGIRHERLLAFADNLYANPSPRAREELYKFLEHKNMPITDDGCFLAYKGVQNDYYSITAGTSKITKGKVVNGKIFNGIGEVIEMERISVNEDPKQGCSYGLHVGSHKYANDFKGSGRMLIVKVNPRDVVSVPNDCNCQKLRTCRYEVVAEEGRLLDEVKDMSFDKVAKLRQKRLANGRFAKAV